MSEVDPGEPSPSADPELAKLIEELNSRPGGTDVRLMREGAAQRARARTKGPDMAVVRDLLVPSPPGAPVVRDLLVPSPQGAPVVRDLLVPSPRGAPAVRTRLYQPHEEAAALVVYAHGGGWTIGSLDTHDRVCRRLAHTSGAAVLAVDYRLAPEAPAPAAVDDMVNVFEWVASAPSELGPEPRAVAAAGDSSGGTLAALACLRLRDAQPTALPDLQVLICPNTDLTGPGQSMRDKASGWGLDAAGVEFFNTQWVPDPRRWVDPAVSPLRAPDLRGLPPALVVTAEHDPLRDQGEAYAQRLVEARVPVELRREVGLVHNFLMYDEMSPACARAGDQLARDIARLLAG